MWSRLKFFWLILQILTRETITNHSHLILCSPREKDFQKITRIPVTTQEWRLLALIFFLLAVRNRAEDN